MASAVDVSVRGTCCCGINIRKCLMVWAAINIVFNVYGVAYSVTRLYILKPRTIRSFLNDDTAQDIIVMYKVAIADKYYALAYAESGVRLILDSMGLLTSGFLFISLFTQYVPGCKLWIKMGVLSLVLEFIATITFVAVKIAFYGVGSVEVAVMKIVFSLCSIVIPMYVLVLVRKFVREVNRIHAEVISRAVVRN